MFEMPTNETRKKGNPAYASDLTDRLRVSFQILPISIAHACLASRPESNVKAGLSLKLNGENIYVSSC
jgi:hypothetical protein